MKSNILTLKKFSTRLEAEMAKEVLESVGIKSFLSADDGGGMRPAPFAYSMGVELIVREEDVQRAKEILDADHSQELKDHFRQEEGL
ncbi:DUF2007 domain-containing protein [Patescibacteria group bacterium]|nr:DUF2007 domain-containing protein [Patescibacteria group bacterium]MBP9709879.1 DUF2007 domain-containing protein [Patescibacteria group bacterium]